jgi:PAS domain S-box-containing protein
MIVCMVDRYRISFDRAPCALVVADPAGTIVDANDAAGRLLGRRHAELVGTPVAGYAGLLRQVAADADDVIWAAADDHVDPVRVLAEVFDEVPVGVVTLDAAGRVRRANEMALHVLGAVDQAELDGLEVTSLDGQPLPVAQWPSTDVLAGRRVDRRQLRVRTPGGDQREVEVSAVPLRAEGRTVTGAVLTIEDVTARSRRERAERDFVSNAAHQLRSPLTAITGAVAVLRSANARDEATRVRFLDHLERETDRIVRLTHALLTLARVERDEVRPRPDVVPVVPLLEAIADEARVDGAVLSVEADDRTAVVANEDLLVEALTNLVVNAVRHGSGTVVLRGRRAAADVLLEVADEGPGIAPEVLERVFDRFYRAEGARAGGFGLGLPIARAAARAAGGELTIESSPTEGTTARIRIAGATLL